MSRFINITNLAKNLGFPVLIEVPETLTHGTICFVGPDIYAGAPSHTPVKVGADLAAEIAAIVADVQEVTEGLAAVVDEVAEGPFQNLAQDNNPAATDQIMIRDAVTLVRHRVDAFLLAMESARFAELYHDRAIDLKRNAFVGGTKEGMLPSLKVWDPIYEDLDIVGSGDFGNLSVSAVFKPAHQLATVEGMKTIPSGIFTNRNLLSVKPGRYHHPAIKCLTAKSEKYFNGDGTGGTLDDVIGAWHHNPVADNFLLGWHRSAYERYVHRSHFHAKEAAVNLVNNYVSEDSPDLDPFGRPYKQLRRTSVANNVDARYEFQGKFPGFIGTSLTPLPAVRYYYFQLIVKKTDALYITVTAVSGSGPDFPGVTVGASYRIAVSIEVATLAMTNSFSGWTNPSFFTVTPLMGDELLIRGVVGENRVAPSFNVFGRNLPSLESNDTSTHNIGDILLKVGNFVSLDLGTVAPGSMPGFIPFHGGWGAEAGRSPAYIDDLPTLNPHTNGVVGAYGPGSNTVLMKWRRPASPANGSGVRELDEKLMNIVLAVELKGKDVTGTMDITTILYISHTPGRLYLHAYVTGYGEVPELLYLGQSFPGGEAFDGLNTIAVSYNRSARRALVFINGLAINLDNYPIPAAAIMSRVGLGSDVSDGFGHGLFELQWADTGGTGAGSAPVKNFEVLNGYITEVIIQENTVDASISLTPGKDAPPAAHLLELPPEPGPADGYGYGYGYGDGEFSGMGYLFE